MPKPKFKIGFGVGWNWLSRTFENHNTAVFIATASLIAGCVTASVSRTDQTPSKFCKPNQACWPSPAEWRELGAKLRGKLEIPQSPLAPCRTDATSSDCSAAMNNLKNPYFIEEQAAGTQSTGWLGAWTASVSAYALAAETSNDILAAVKFARLHKLRLVIKGTGHDYFGRSNAPDSLLIWTHKMRKIDVLDTFVPTGCSSVTTSYPAVILEAGVRWVEAYEEVTKKRGRYVQGGGCTSVGAAGGFLQGGGFGHWSKKFGTAAANMLEAQVVTADGRLLVANACQNQDLFWALRGGGGGTFGVVTKVALRTHPLPKYFGWVKGAITAKSDNDFKELLEQFLRFYRENLSNEYWGEQVKVKGDNSLELSLAFQGMEAKAAEKIWKPLRNWIEQHPGRFAMSAKYFAIPGRKMWNYEYIAQNFPSAIKTDTRPGETANHYWWEGDGEQVSLFWYAYQSRWLPLHLFEGANAKNFAAVLFEASRHWSLELHFNKGQAGASRDAIQRGRDTSINPTLYNAAALVISAAGTPRYPGVTGHEPDLSVGETQKRQVSSAMGILRKATPGAGTYFNESDYFEPDWQKTFWGENYQKLREIKQKYDPERTFTCHHCVGSEEE